MKRFDVVYDTCDGALMEESENGEYVRREDSQAEIERLQAAMRGWDSYAWKEQAYVDDIQQYFDLVLGGMDAGEALYAVNSGDKKPAATSGTTT